MLATLLSFLGGSAFRMLWGEISAAWTKHQDHKHEIELLRLQAEAETRKHEQQMAMVKLQAEQGVQIIRVQGDADVARMDAQAFAEAVRLTGTPTGIGWVDAWNGSIRPALATMCIVLWATHVARSGFVLDDNGWALLAAALGIYIADRTLRLRGK